MSSRGKAGGRWQSALARPDVSDHQLVTGYRERMTQLAHPEHHVGRKMGPPRDQGFQPVDDNDQRETPPLPYLLEGLVDRIPARAAPAGEGENGFERIMTAAAPFASPINTSTDLAPTGATYLRNSSSLG